MTSGQSSSVAVRGRPIYLNDVTVYSGLPYSWNTISDHPVPDPLLVARFSSRNLARRGWWWGGVCWVPPMKKTCSNHGNRGEDRSLPTESLSCPARGGASSESVGWYVLFPTACSPPLGIQCTQPIKGRIPYIAWVPVVVGLSPTGGTAPYRYEPGSVPPSIPLPTQLCTLDSVPVPISVT